MSELLQRLEAAIIERRGASPDSSYVASLFAKGREKIAQKVTELVQPLARRTCLSLVERGLSEIPYRQEHTERKNQHPGDQVAVFVPERLEGVDLFLLLQVELCGHI